MSSQSDAGEQGWLRSPELMNADDTALLVVDVQEKLAPLVPGHTRIVWNIGRLVKGAKVLGVERKATQQYPEKLGGLVEPLAGEFASPASKLAFSAAGCRGIVEPWSERGIHRVLVCGIETHVCILQTALDLLASGYRVYVPTDAVGARYDVDHHTALRRMEATGVTLTTTEAALFEWCQVAGTAQFKEIIELAKEPPPDRL